MQLVFQACTHCALTAYTRLHLKTEDGLKTSLILSRVAKIAAVLIVFVAFTWQARVQHQTLGASEHSMLTQQAGLIPQDWAKHRQAQVKEITRTIPNRFALSKAYNGADEAL